MSALYTVYGPVPVAFISPQNKKNCSPPLKQYGKKKALLYIVTLTEDRANCVFYGKS